MEKLKRKINIRLILLIVIALLLIIFLLYMLYIKISVKEIYSIDSRVDKIKEEKKKDNSIYYKTIGWLRVQGTNIDTPIIGYDDDKIEKDNKYNLTVDKKNYLWNEINSEKLYNKVNIMGHNILNLSREPDVGLKQFSRFDDLMAFVYYDFIKDNKYIQYTIDGKDYIYQIFSVNFDYQENLDLYTYGNYSKKNMKKYIDKVRKNSIYDFNVKVSDSDNIISLITCTRMYGADDQKEFIVNAKMVKNDKKLYNYKVSKNNNYKKIEKMLKGDVEDEKA